MTKQTNRETCQVLTAIKTPSGFIKILLSVLFEVLSVFVWKQAFGLCGLSHGIFGQVLKFSCDQIDDGDEVLCCFESPCALPSGLNQAVQSFRKTV